ncbi:MAG: hypothetical protein JKX99_09225 [Robiginitomaculum sp.]|nr:hypothetical protein [Robiginitomaculum sp.]
MKKPIMLAILGVLASATPTLSAEICRAPMVPQLPINGAVITHDQLMSAADQVSIFSKSNTSYKTCLDAVITQPANVTREKWREALRAYNQTAPTEQAIWGAYEKLSGDWVVANQVRSN